AAREAEGREEANEAGWGRRGPTGSLPGRAQPRREELMRSVRHLYVHLPFCSHRGGYCDFVTVVGRNGQHDRYVDALLAELELERHVLTERLETIFLGGGTPALTRPAGPGPAAGGGAPGRGGE